MRITSVARTSGQGKRESMRSMAQCASLRRSPRRSRTESNRAAEMATELPGMTRSARITVPAPSAPHSERAEKFEGQILRYRDTLDPLATVAVAGRLTMK